MFSCQIGTKIVCIQWFIFQIGQCIPNYTHITHIYIFQKIKCKQYTFCQSTKINRPHMPFSIVYFIVSLICWQIQKSNWKFISLIFFCQNPVAISPKIATRSSFSVTFLLWNKISSSHVPIRALKNFKNIVEMCCMYVPNAAWPMNTEFH